MGHFTSLRESTSPIAKELHTLITIHPAFPYIRTSYLYDSLYANFKADTDNLSEARIRTTIHICHILDEIAHSLGLISSNVHYSVPEHIFHDAFSNPKYKAYSSSVTHESRLRQEQRLQQKLRTTSSLVNATTDPFNTLMHSLVKSNKSNKSNNKE